MILVIDNFDSFTYNLVQLVGELGYEVKVYRNDAISLQEAERLAPSHIIISPGPGTPDTAGVTLDMIRRFAGKTPILGVCLGNQAIGQAFGGKVVHARTLMHGKTSEIEHDGEGVLTGLPQGFSATRYHSLAVERGSLPVCLTVSAWAADGEIMGLRHREFEVEGVQFHPESVVTGAVGRRLLANFLDRGSRTRPVDLRSAIAHAVDGKPLSREETEGALRVIMSGEATPAQIASFLTALRMRGETVEEITAAATVMREKAHHVARPTDRVVVDTCGTGGDGSHTINISTVAALVAAGAGLTVAKHGNRGVSSTCGSADVLRELGVDVNMPPARMETCLREAGIAFLFAPTLHAAMKHVIGPRREIGIRTLFNILGPLANPAGADAQLLGVYDRKLVPTLAHVLGNLGVRRALVVHGSDGLDEITLTGPTHAAYLEDGKVREETIDPRALGLTGCAREDLVGGPPAENARIALSILSGKDRGPRRSVVLLNAAAAILIGGAAQDLEEGMARAAAAIDSGAAMKRLERLKELSRA